MKIVNLTQHIATPDQIEAGVIELEGHHRETLHQLLTFDVIPTPEDLWERARKIARLVTNLHGGGVQCMLGGAPYLMGILERVLHEEYRCYPMYAFSRRESVEDTQPDGSVKKLNVFRHVGFVYGGTADITNYDE